MGTFEDFNGQYHYIYLYHSMSFNIKFHICTQNQTDSQSWNKRVFQSAASWQHTWQRTKTYYTSPFHYTSCIVGKVTGSGPKFAISLKVKDNLNFQVDKFALENSEFQCTQFFIITLPTALFNKNHKSSIHFPYITTIFYLAAI